MAQKEEKNRMYRQTDRQKHQSQLADIEKKLITDEVEAIQHNEKIRQNVSINQQFVNLNKFKYDEARRLRDEADERRRILDEQIRFANQADAKLQEERKAQLRQMMEDDKKAKLLHKMLVEAKDQGRPAQDVISYVYDKDAILSPRSTTQLRSPLLKSVGAQLM